MFEEQMARYARERAMETHVTFEHRREKTDKIFENQNRLQNRWIDTHFSVSLFIFIFLMKLIINQRNMSKNI